MDTKSAFENSDELHLSTQGKQFLKEAAGWARFLSLGGLVGVGLLVVGAVGMLVFGAFSRFSVGPFEGSVILLVYSLMALVYFFPLYYLYQFSVKAIRAAASHDSAALDHCFRFLRSHYRFLGILVIAFLGIYILGIALAILGVAGHSF